MKKGCYLFLISCISLSLTACSTVADSTHSTASDNSTESSETKSSTKSDWVEFGEPFSLVRETLQSKKNELTSEAKAQEIGDTILEPTLVSLTGEYYSNGYYLTLCYAGDESMYIMPYSIDQLKSYGLKFNDGAISLSSLQKNKFFEPYLMTYDKVTGMSEEQNIFFIGFKANEAICEELGDITVDLGICPKKGNGYNQISVYGGLPNLIGLGAKNQEQYLKDSKKIITDFANGDLTQEEVNETKFMYIFEDGRYFENEASYEDYKKAVKESKEAAEKSRQEEQYKKRLKESEPMIGMTAEEVKMTKWGEPSKINKTETRYGTHEQWVYNLFGYVYLDDGIVTSVQTSLSK